MLKGRVEPLEVAIFLPNFAYSFQGMFNEAILHRPFLAAFGLSFNSSFALMANLQGTLNFSPRNWRPVQTANSVTDLLGSKFRKCEMNEGKEGVRLKRGQSQFARPKRK